MTPEMIVWDFDGVLNANMRGARFFWSDNMQADLGLDPNALSAHLFSSGLMRDIVRGRQDLRDVLADWLAPQGSARTADELLTYWFENDAHPDAQVLDWLAAHPARHVIGTNNESRRAAYIETEMGFGTRVAHIFASGRMGVAKPDPGFFAEIERWSGLAPPRILLVDDSAANVSAARARGWQGFLFNERTRSDLPARLGLT